MQNDEQILLDKHGFVWYNIDKEKVESEDNIMTIYTIEKQTNMRNAGIEREWALCHHYGVERTKHDKVRYDQGSDLDVNDKHISIKASGFSLMSSTLCEGRTDFDGIWAIYESRTHSNRFAYVSKDYTVYEMSLAEFKAFVYMFGYLSRDSKANGGRVKIQALKESKKMLNWLAAQAVA